MPRRLFFAKATGPFLARSFEVVASQSDPYDSLTKEIGFVLREQAINPLGPEEVLAASFPEKEAVALAWAILETAGYVVPEAFKSDKRGRN